MKDDKVAQATIQFGRKEGYRLFNEIMDDYPAVDENDLRASTIALELFENAVKHLRMVHNCSDKFLIKTLIYNIDLADKWIEEHGEEND